MYNSYLHNFQMLVSVSPLFQLWQFLVALLDDPANAAFIAWTGRGLEFKLIEPEEVEIIFLLIYSFRYTKTLLFVFCHKILFSFVILVITLS